MTADAALHVCMRVTYCDAKQQITSRWVVVYGVDHDSSGQPYAIKTYCFRRRALRTLLVGGIIDIADADGVVCLASDLIGPWGTIVVPPAPDNTPAHDAQHDDHPPDDCPDLAAAPPLPPPPPSVPAPPRIVRRTAGIVGSALGLLGVSICVLAVFGGVASGDYRMAAIVAAGAVNIAATLGLLLSAVWPSAAVPHVIRRCDRRMAASLWGGAYALSIACGLVAALAAPGT